VTWEHMPVAGWLIGTKSSWHLAGQGRAFDEVRRLIPRVGGSYELCASPATHATLLVIDGTLSHEEEDPAYWVGRIAPGAVVVIAGIHPAAGASELWRRWCETIPTPATFRIAAGHGLGLLLPAPELAPSAVQELLTSGSSAAALFNAATLAAQRIAEAIRDAEAARALAHRLDTLHLHDRELEADAHNLQMHLDREHARGDGLVEQITILTSSTTFRVAMILRRLTTLLPQDLRLLLKRAAKLAWWTLRGRLLISLQARRDLLEAAGNHSATIVKLPGSVQEEQVEVVAVSGLPAAASAATPYGAGLSGRPLIRVALGYVVADGNLARLTRAVDRAHRALAAIGQRQMGCIMVTDDGAPVSLRRWLPADILVLPRRGTGGFLAAHGRMMEVAFAQRADVYVLTETRSRFNETTLAASLSAVAEHGSEGVFAVGGDLEPLVDAESPTFLVITRGAAARLGAIDVRLDAPCGLLDLYMRAEILGINAVRLKSHSLSFDANRADMLAASRLGRYALDAAWVLAGKWDCEPLAAQIRLAYNARDIVPPPIVAAEHSGRDALLVAWWERRVSDWPRGNRVKVEAPADQKAVLPPTQLDASLAVPFDTAAVTSTDADRRMAAIIHLRDEELGQHTFDVLKHIPGGCDLFITTDTDAKRNTIESVFDRWTDGSVDVRALPNRDGHIVPMLDVLREIVQKYDIVLHLHGNPVPPFGEKSIPKGREAEWREYLYETLCGSREIVASVFTAFAASPRLGIVFPQHWSGLQRAISWGNSFEDAQDLAARMGTDLCLGQPLEFPTGFMFWARTASLAPLLSFDLTAADFVEGDREAIFARAVERLLLRACEHSGHKWVKIARTDKGDVVPAPLTVESPERLKERLDCICYLLTDPALWQVERKKSAWRFRPEDNERPRLTLIAGANLPREPWNRFESVARARFPQVDIRIQTVPRSEGSTGVPSSIGVRAEETFVATDETCAQVALQLVQLQQRFFSRSNVVQLLDQWIKEQSQLSELSTSDAMHDNRWAT
jgi:hypothetical protein